MIDITPLKNESKEKIEFDENLEYTSDDLKNTSIKRLENVNAKGFISRVSDDVYHLELTIQGNMVLVCARSLEEVNYPINIFIDKNVSENVIPDEKQIFFQNSLDIFGIVWENIVLEVPLRVVKEGAQFLKEGNGWSLLDENESTSSSPFSELGSMLDMEGKR